MTVSEDLPQNLPKPIDDGKADHLTGMSLPDLSLLLSSGKKLNISKLINCVLFIFPKAGSSLEDPIDFEIWDAIPGARGCTPQSCAYRDLNNEFSKYGFDIFGLSVQKPEVLKEVQERNHIPFDLISDSDLELTGELSLPTFMFKSRELIKRITLIIKNGKIKKVFYPVFPSDKDATTTLNYIIEHHTK